MAVLLLAGYFLGFPYLQGFISFEFSSKSRTLRVSVSCKEKKVNSMDDLLRSLPVLTFNEIILQVRTANVLRNGVFPAISIHKGFTVISDYSSPGQPGKRTTPVT